MKPDTVEYSIRVDAAYYDDGAPRYVIREYKGGEWQRNKYATSSIVDALCRLHSFVKKAEAKL